VNGDSGTPAALNRISSEIPRTTSGITRGASMTPDTMPLAKNRRRTSAIDAGIAREVATIAVSVATSRLVLSALSSAGSCRNWWYHLVVNPSHGNDTISLSLKEKTIKMTIGA
jgi:hypothetical protein